MKHTNEPPSPLFGSPAPTPTPTPKPVDPNVRPQDIKHLTGQNAQLLDWLMDGERVTARTAYDRGMQRLAARVHDLRKAGYRVRDDYSAADKCAVYWINPSDARTAPHNPGQAGDR